MALPAWKVCWSFMMDVVALTRSPTVFRGCCRYLSPGKTTTGCRFSLLKVVARAWKVGAEIMLRPPPRSQICWGRSSCHLGKDRPRGCWRPRVRHRSRCHRGKSCGNPGQAGPSVQWQGQTFRFLWHDVWFVWGPVICPYQVCQGGPCTCVSWYSAGRHQMRDYLGRPNSRGVLQLYLQGSHVGGQRRDRVSCDYSDTPEMENIME